MKAIEALAKSVKVPTRLMSSMVKTGSSVNKQIMPFMTAQAGA
jgi:hypothetical protein